MLFGVDASSLDEFLVDSASFSLACRNTAAEAKSTHDSCVGSVTPSISLTGPMMETPETGNNGAPHHPIYPPAPPLQPM